MVYSPAYCPRLCAWLREIQNAFMNGIDNISPNVITTTAPTATIAVPGSKLYIIYENAQSATPIVI